MSSYGQRPITQVFILDSIFFQAGEQSYLNLLVYLRTKQVQTISSIFLVEPI